MPDIEVRKNEDRLNKPFNPIFPGKSIFFYKLCIHVLLIMKYVLFLFFSSFLCHGLYAQFEFKKDSLDKLNPRNIRDIDTLFQVTGKGDFQLLFWMLPGQEDRRTLLVLTYLNEHWQARYFQRQKENNKLAWNEHPIPQDGIENLWSELVKNEVLRLKSSEELANFKYRPEEDGILYFIELRNATGKRAYYYHCPLHQQPYNKHPELERMINMIRLLYEFSREKQKPVCFSGSLFMSVSRMV